MLCTLRSASVPPYLGIDLTDGYSAARRPVDVCGLTPGDGGLSASFWTWVWSLDGFESVVRELREARCAFLDGPQGLAAPGASLRQCERLTGAAGKTPSARDDIRGPYAGFIRSSVELFSALSAAGVPISAPGFVGGVGEVYPGHSWKSLAPGIDKKTTPSGLRQRVAVLELLGVQVPAQATHDQLDAAFGAMLAAAADGLVPGLQIEAVGHPLVRRADGDLEEGPIAVPRPSESLATRIVGALGPGGSSRAAERRARTNQQRGAAALRCPIPGCAHVFQGSRGGWDAHAASLRAHPEWLPQVRNPEMRKAAFRIAFPGFFA